MSRGDRPTAARENAADAEISRLGSIAVGPGLAASSSAGGLALALDGRDRLWGEIVAVGPPHEWAAVVGGGLAPMGATAWPTTASTPSVGDRYLMRRTPHDWRYFPARISPPTSAPPCAVAFRAIGCAAWPWSTGWIAGAVVRLDRGGDRIAEGTTDAAGLVVFEGVAPGPATLSAEPPSARFAPIADRPVVASCGVNPASFEPADGYRCVNCCPIPLRPSLVARTPWGDVPLSWGPGPGTGGAWGGCAPVGGLDVLVVECLPYGPPFHACSLARLDWPVQVLLHSTCGLCVRFAPSAGSPPPNCLPAPPGVGIVAPGCAGTSWLPAPPDCPDVNECAWLPAPPSPLWTLSDAVCDDSGAQLLFRYDGPESYPYESGMAVLIEET